MPDTNQEGSAVTEPEAPEAELTAAEKKEARRILARDEGIEAMEQISQLRDSGAAASSLMAFSPATFADAMELANVVCNSGIVSDGLKGRPGATITVMARGASLGVPWATAVTVGHVVHGAVGWPAELLHAVVDRSPEVEYFDVKHADNESATVVAKAVRWKEEREHKVTMADAKAMGFCDGKHSKLWVGDRPRPMLIAFARREAAREWFPALTLGLVTIEELEDEGGPGERNITPPATPTAQLEEFAKSTAQEPEAASDEEPKQEPAAEIPAPEPETQAAAEDLSDAEKAEIEKQEAAEAAAAEAPPKLSEEAIKRILELRKAIPIVGLDRLVHALGGNLDQLQGKAGETGDELEQRVLAVLEECKKQVTAQG